MSVDSIEKLFVEELKDLYSAENQITKALPKMVNTATSIELKQTFESHLERPRARFSGLKGLAKFLGQAPRVRRATE